MSIRVLVNGANGRMGQLATKAVSEDNGLELVGTTDKDDDLKKEIEKSRAQVVVDFTHPDVVFNNVVTIIESGAHPVIGTSGLKKDQIVILQMKCNQLKTGGIIVPNFSIGAVLMMKCAKQIVAYLPSVEIIEMHHANKVDSPSGTALRTAQLIAEGRNVTAMARSDLVENVPGARGATVDNIAIHSVRLSGILAKQIVIFGGVGETLTITHESIQRESFMPGVCHACKKVLELQHLAYGLEEIL